MATGSAFPDVDLHLGFPPTKVSTKTLLAGKKSLVVTLPGAFTPTWSTCQVPGYLAGEKEGRLEDAGIDQVIVVCVNDGAVMTAWKKDQKIPNGSIIEFMGDPSSELTAALGIELTHPGPCFKLGPKRCKRGAYYVDDGTIKVVQISEKPDDPAGDDFPETSCIDNMLKLIGEL